MLKRTGYLIVGILFLTLSAFGQNQEKNNSTPHVSESKIDLARSIRLEKDSKTEEILIEVKANTQRIQFVISSSVRDGELTIELYDPNDVKQGNFTIGTQLKSEKKERVNGNIKKSIIEPQKGNWRIKIIPKEATGNVNIRTAIIE